MGMFGSRKKTYVSSVPYNMAGDENDRPNYLKTTIFGAVLNETPSLGNAITNSYLKGPAIRFRNFARWSRTSGYVNTVGLATGSLSVGNSVDVNVLRDQIPHGSNQVVQVQSVQIGDADYTWWADRWMLENHPDRINEDWTADINGQTITILFGGVSTYTFDATDFDQTGRYLYASYLLADNPSDGPVVPGTTVELGPTDPWPSTSGWSTISDDTNSNDVTLTNKVIIDVTYSDGRPSEHTETPTDRIESVAEHHRVYKKTEYMGNKPGTDQTYSITSTMYQDEVANVTTSSTESSVEEDIGGGVIKTTKTTNITQTLGTKRTYRVDTMETIQSSWSGTKVFIYKHGSGNAILDAMFSPSTGNQDFFPYIPFRVDNKFISPSYLPDVYDEAKKALKKSTTGKYDDIISKIADNESLDDIDYAYAVFGVSLNVKEVACREYIYRFFKGILDAAGVGGDGAYNAWKLEWDAADASMTQWNKWKTAQGNPSDPLYGTPEPAKKPYPPMPSSEIKIRSDNNRVLNYNITVSWNAIIEATGTGQAKPGAKQGDLWFQVNTDDVFEEQGYVGGVWGTVAQYLSNNIDLYWQDGNNTYRVLKLRGLTHRNEIYNGKAVEIDGREALQDTEESGFIVPLHEGIYRSMPLTKSTQMATACSFLVFNCYQVVKKKWYQTGLFQVILIIIIIIVSIYTGGAGAGASGGLLGTNAAVGAAIGLTGVAAIIVGAIANAIAAMLLVTIIQRGAVAIFGDKLGTIIGAIASVIALNVGTAMANGQTMAQGFGNMMRADNLMQLTSVALDSYAKYINVSTQGILEETQGVLERYKVESEEIQQAFADTFGVNKGVIDPLSLTDSARYFGFVPESPTSFLERTLMVGSDIADLSLNMLGQFADLTLNTNLQL